MNNEEKILQILTQMQTDITELKQKVTKVEVTIENEVNKNIGLLVDGHIMLNEKLDSLKDLNEQVIELKSDSSVHRAAITELVRKTAK